MCCCEHALALARVQAEEELLRASQGETGAATAAAGTKHQATPTAGVPFCQMWWAKLMARRRS